jgi:hypothetical protein
MSGLQSLQYGNGMNNIVPLMKIMLAGRYPCFSNKISKKKKKDQIEEAII